LHVQAGDAGDDGDAGDAGDKQISGCLGSDVNIYSALYKVDSCASGATQRNIVKMWRSKVSTSK